MFFFRIINIVLKDIGLDNDPLFHLVRRLSYNVTAAFVAPIECFIKHSYMIMLLGGSAHISHPTFSSQYTKSMWPIAGKPLHNSDRQALHLTVEHILIECSDFAEVRRRYETENLQQLFHEISVTGIFAFLLEIGLFYRM